MLLKNPRNVALAMVGTSVIIYMLLMSSGRGSVETTAQEGAGLGGSAQGGSPEWYQAQLSTQGCRDHPYEKFLHSLPAQQCQDGRRIGKCRDGSKFVCGLDQLRSKGEDCVMYSFGSSDDACFETDFVAQFPKCKVHIFDPTSKEIPNKKWVYHSYGLGGWNLSDTRYWNWRTQRPESCPTCKMKTMHQIMVELGHDFVDIVKIDIDGAEWRSFDLIFDVFGFDLPFGQLQLELTGLDIRPSTRPDVRVFDHLAKAGYKIFHVEANLGTCKRKWIDYEGGVLPDRTIREGAPSYEFALSKTDRSRR